MPAIPQPAQSSGPNAQPTLPTLRVETPQIHCLTAWSCLKNPNSCAAEVVTTEFAKDPSIMCRLYWGPIVAGHCIVPSHLNCPPVPVERWNPGVVLWGGTGQGIPPASHCCCSRPAWSGGKLSGQAPPPYTQTYPHGHTEDWNLNIPNFSQQLSIPPLFPHIPPYCPNIASLIYLFDTFNGLLIMLEGQPESITLGGRECSL